MNLEPEDAGVKVGSTSWYHPDANCGLLGKRCAQGLMQWLKSISFAHKKSGSRFEVRISPISKGQMDQVELWTILREPTVTGRKDLLVAAISVVSCFHRRPLYYVARKDTNGL